MIGIRKIASYIPPGRISNYHSQGAFDVDKHFIESKIGVKSVSRKGAGENTSDLCCRAFDTLSKGGGPLPEQIDAIVVCTQTPDYQLPHTSAIVHGKLGLDERCAAFDISLGCSGYVYGLSIAIGWMTSMGFKNALFFTADPYSKIINPDDKNTALLFGDAATVTYLNDNPVLSLGPVSFGTRGTSYEDLVCTDGELSMNGRGIFNFVAEVIPPQIKDVLEKGGLEIGQIDSFILHQGSKFIIDFLIKRGRLPIDKTPYDIAEYGNTVSSSIPIILSRLLDDENLKNILISGFGVGLSWATAVLLRVSQKGVK